MKLFHSNSFSGSTVFPSRQQLTHVVKPSESFKSQPITRKTSDRSVLDELENHFHHHSQLKRTTQKLYFQNPYALDQNMNAGIHLKSTLEGGIFCFWTFENANLIKIKLWDYLCWAVILEHDSHPILNLHTKGRHLKFLLYKAGWRQIFCKTFGSEISSHSTPSTLVHVHYPFKRGKYVPMNRKAKSCFAGSFLS